MQRDATECALLLHPVLRFLPPSRRSREGEGRTRPRGRVLVRAELSPRLNPAGEPFGPLTLEQLQSVVTQATANLSAAGYDVSDLSQVHFVLAGLPNSLLGLTYQNTIWIDQSAQGYGWYTDVSANSNAAFTQVTGTNEVQAAPGSSAYGHVDLLTVVTHELGHVLGFASVDASILGHDWMSATLGTGVRRYPDAVAGSGRPPALEVPIVAAMHASPAGNPWASGNSLTSVVAALLVSPASPGLLEDPTPLGQLPEPNRAMVALTASLPAAAVAVPGSSANDLDSAFRLFLDDRKPSLQSDRGPAIDDAFSRWAKQGVALLSPGAQKPIAITLQDKMLPPRTERQPQELEEDLLEGVFSSLRRRKHDLMR